MPQLNRRSFVKAGLVGPGLGVMPGIGRGAAARSYLEESPDMLQAHLAGKLNTLASRWDDVRGRIQTPDETAARNQFVRERVREMLGGFPPRGPLSPVVARSQARRGYLSVAGTESAARSEVT